MDKIIPNNIKELRMKKGMSLRKLAAKSGVSKSEIHNLENGFSLPDQDTILLISMALNMITTDVFWLDTDMPDLKRYMQNKKELSNILDKN